ncbi:DUF779 domain-containing protein [Cupriavidus sp. LEh25]|nr:DUF779 domain-containing protein [Cupriavidus sp. LEh25]
MVLLQKNGALRQGQLVCWPRSDYLASSREICIGDIGGTPLYVLASELALLERAQLVVDAGPGTGGWFAMQRKLGICFFTRTRRMPS